MKRGKIDKNSMNSKLNTLSFFSFQQKLRRGSGDKSQEFQLSVKITASKQFFKKIISEINLCN